MSYYYYTEYSVSIKVSRVFFNDTANNDAPNQVMLKQVQEVTRVKGP